MRAIRTRYVGPTNTRGSRYIANDGNGHRLSVGCLTELADTDNHRRAAQALIDKLPAQAGGVFHLRGYTYGHDQMWVLVPGSGI